MIQREHIEKLLKLNGIETNAKDEEIRSVLISARFDHEEVDTALMVLRENVETKKTRVDGLHKVFRTDKSLSSAEINSLLGINVCLEDRVLVGAKSRTFSTLSGTLVLLLSVFVAFVAVTSYMYMTKTGFFHSTSAFAAKLEK